MKLNAMQNNSQEYVQYKNIFKNTITHDVYDTILTI